MERTSTASTRVAVALLAVLFAASVYRAATLDVTPGEAWNYDRYIGPSWQESLGHWDVNNHFFYTLLARISTRNLHHTELSLRLPSLLCGLLYCWAAWRLCRRLFGRSWAFTAALGVMTLNPLIADSLSEARGYGMAMAFLLWAIVLLLECLEEFSERKLNWIAILLALSAAACLSFFVPAIGLMGSARLTLRRRLSRDLLLPFLVFLFVLMVLPLNRASLSDFKQGGKSLEEMIGELSSWSFSFLPQESYVVLSVEILAVLIGLRTVVRSPKRDLLIGLTAGTAAIALGVLVAAHIFLKTPYPERGAVYFVPLLTLLLLALGRPHARAVMAGAVFCCVVYAAEFPVGLYIDGPDLVGGREIAKAIRTDAKGRPIRVATTLELEPIMNYYRTRYHQDWERIERKSPEAGYDYYVLTEPAMTERLGLRVIHRVYGLLLAKP